MRTKKNRPSKRVYLIREISELWERLSPLAKLLINKVRAHCLECHDADFSADQVNHAFWAFHQTINRKNGGEYFFSSRAIVEDGRLIGLQKIDDSSDGRAILERGRKESIEKSAKRVQTQIDYLNMDVNKKIISGKSARRIIDSAIVDPSHLLTA